LAETDIAQEVADKWIAISEGKIADMLELVKNTIHDAQGSMIQGTGAISEDTCGKAGDDERTTGRSAGRDESGNL
jgi:hypothetical protein